jgi:predicted transcriptional regulator
VVANLAGQGRTLREIAAEVGVSHETVRKALKDRGTETADNRRVIRFEPARIALEGVAVSR